MNEIVVPEILVYCLCTVVISAESQEKALTPSVSGNVRSEDRIFTLTILAPLAAASTD